MERTVAMSSNADLERRLIAAVPSGVSVSLPIFAAQAFNSEITDIDGRSYVDFAGGIAVLNTGHLHSKVKAAVTEQLERFSHTCFHVVPYEGYVRLAERLNAIVPID